MNFFIGCAIWAYKGWVGEFYPPKARATDFLHLYSRRLTTVEGNTTFYATPNPETVTRWSNQTPPEFEFCLKLPREITHNGLLQPHITHALNFLENMLPLGKNLGPMFAQLPPSYSPQSLDDLTNFLQSWPKNTAPLALEVRHPDWFREPHAHNLTALLETLNIARVLLDTRPIYSGKEDPQLHSARRKPNYPTISNYSSIYLDSVYFPSHPISQSAIYGRVDKLYPTMLTTGKANLLLCPLSHRRAIAPHCTSLL